MRRWQKGCWIMTSRNNASRLFAQPDALNLLAHFVIPQVQTWGSKNDAAFKERVRNHAVFAEQVVQHHEWFVFSVRCVVSRSRMRNPRWVPDVENMSKLIVDAFIDVLYPDDNLHYVRGIQVEAEWGSGPEEYTEVVIYGKLKSS